MKTLRNPRPLDGLAVALTLILLWPTISRFERPVQDRDFGSFDGGSTDFICNYLGSLAFVRGYDPYLNGRPEFRDPWRREMQMDGVLVSQYYLPGHFIVLAPFALLYGDDVEAAARAYFGIEVALTILLALIVAMAARREVVKTSAENLQRTVRVWIAAIALFCLQVGARVGFERGQSDIIQAVLFWAGIWAASAGRPGLAAFLVVTGTSMKGYGLILLLGLAFLSLRRGRLKIFLIGGLAAGLPILALTSKYVLTALKVASYKADDFSFHWTIHGFKHVGFAISETFAEPIRGVLTLAAVVISFVCWKRASESHPGSQLGLVVAATASLATMVGYSASSHAYNLVLLLPGLVWIAAKLLESSPEVPTHEALFSFAFLLIATRSPFRTFAPAAYGLILFLVWCVCFRAPNPSVTPDRLTPKDALL